MPKCPLILWKNVFKIFHWDYIANCFEMGLQYRLTKVFLCLRSKINILLPTSSLEGPEVRLKSVLLAPVDFGGVCARKRLVGFMFCMSIPSSTSWYPQSAVGCLSQYPWVRCWSSRLSDKVLIHNQILQEDRVCTEFALSVGMDEISSIDGMNLKITALSSLGAPALLIYVDNIQK